MSFSLVGVEGCKRLRRSGSGPLGPFRLRERKPSDERVVAMTKASSRDSCSCSMRYEYRKNIYGADQEEGTGTVQCARCKVRPRGR